MYLCIFENSNTNLIVQLHTLSVVHKYRSNHISASGYHGGHKIWSIILTLPSLRRRRNSVQKNWELVRTTRMPYVHIVTTLFTPSTNLESFFQGSGCRIVIHLSFLVISDESGFFSLGRKIRAISCVSPILSMTFYKSFTSSWSRVRRMF